VIIRLSRTFLVESPRLAETGGYRSSALIASRVSNWRLERIRLNGSILGCAVDWM